MMSLWDALRMNMMISYQELVRTFLKLSLTEGRLCICLDYGFMQTIMSLISFMPNFISPSMTWAKSPF
ncbi:hypothetical protein B2J95_04170 [Enterobacter cloacae]|nr:hypothetical protein B2J95_04170 [Enterobacter cloacae]KTJ73927.1 hypothetical protein ASU78_17660 [Enterobacter cloacae subsp. cloacae]